MTHIQQQIMMYLAERIDAKSKDITAALQISYATFQRAVPELYDEDFVKKTKVGSMHVSRYSLTDDGLSVANRMIRYHATEGQIVQPSRINKLAGEYEQPIWNHRQCGNKDYRSVGVPC